MGSGRVDQETACKTQNEYRQAVLLCAAEFTVDFCRNMIVK